ncbi:MAG: hypothetical protein Q9159_000628 [Coniocarpon cinnabarinum]
MDPLSITTGVVGLISFGNEAQSLLRKTYKNLRYARIQIEDLATDLEFTNGLFDNLAALMDRAPDTLPANFKKQANRTLFEEIKERCNLDRELTDRLPSSERMKWLMDKTDLSEKQRRMKQIQMDFLFLHTSLSYASFSSPAAPPPPAIGGSRSPPGSSGSGSTPRLPSMDALTSLANVPLQLSTDSSAPVQFTATLSIQPRPATARAERYSFRESMKKSGRRRSRRRSRSRSRSRSGGREERKYMSIPEANVDYDRRKSEEAMKRRKEEEEMKHRKEEEKELRKEEEEIKRRMLEEEMEKEGLTETEKKMARRARRAKESATLARGGEVPDHAQRLASRLESLRVHVDLPDIDRVTN